MSINEYKLRAECVCDIRKLRKDPIFSKGLRSFNIKGSVFLEVELTFKSVLDLDKIKGRIGLIEDGHVMFETVKLLSEYTGERTYSY